jgi:hypothetical protein
LRVNISLTMFVLVVLLLNCTGTQYRDINFLDLKNMIINGQEVELKKVTLSLNRNGTSLFEKFDVASLLRLAVRYENEAVVKLILDEFPDMNILNSPSFVETIISIQNNSSAEEYKNLIFSNIRFDKDNDFYSTIMELGPDNQVLVKEMINQYLLQKSDDVPINKDKLANFLELLLDESEISFFIEVVEYFPELEWSQLLRNLWDTIAELPNSDILRIFTHESVNINYIDNSNRIFLTQVLFKKRGEELIDLISDLIRLGADPKLGDFPKHVLLSSGYNSMAAYTYLFDVLRNAGFNFDTLDSDRVPYIFYTLSSNASLEYSPGQKYFYNMLKNEVNLKVFDQLNQNLVHKAVLIDDMEILIELVEKYGLSVNQKDKYGYIPLQDSIYSVRSINLKIVRYLYASGSKLSEPELKELKKTLVERLGKDAADSVFQ